MENIILKFGSFDYASQRVPLDVKRFDEHLCQSVPNWSTNGATEFKHPEESKTVTPDPPIQRVRTIKTKKRPARMENNSVRRTMITKTVGMSPEPLPSSIKVSSASEKVPKLYENIEAAFTYNEEILELSSENSDDGDPLRLP